MARAHNGFYTPQGIRSARLLTARPPFIRSKRVTGAYRRGIVYERKALDKLEREVAAVPGAVFHRSPWIEYTDDTGKHWCQPDAIGWSPASEPYGFVWEVKYKHCAEAWFQLWRLYIPILEKLFVGRKWQGIEVVKWFDAAISFPEPYQLTDSITRIPRGGRTAVHIYNPSRD